MDLREFIPNLIPNYKSEGKEIIYELIEKNGGYDQYLVSAKKDGCRLELYDKRVISRSMKTPGSELVVKRFQKLALLFDELGIIGEGEFYAHGFEFREILRFFNNTDVTRESEIKKLTKWKSLYEEEVNGKIKWVKREPRHIRELNRFDAELKTQRSVEWLTTFHPELKFWLFDGIVIDDPNLPFGEKMMTIYQRLEPYMEEYQDVLVLPQFKVVKSRDELDDHYQSLVDKGWEGVVLTHKQHNYKFGRSTLKSGTLLKMKDDQHEFDGVVIEVEEGDVVKEGVERTRDSLGKSRTSKKKEDRQRSGMAKGFVVKFGDGQFTVGLKGFPETKRAEIWRNKADYVGRHFKYSGMPPVKDYPRHAYFSEWRDEK